MEYVQRPFFCCIWMKVCVLDTGSGPENYNSYILKYVCDKLCKQNDPNTVLSQIDKNFPLKPDSVGKQDVY